MNRKELTYRLSVLGMKKVDFAAALGMAPDTLYQWEQAPQYAVTVLQLMEENAKLKLANEGLRGVLERKK